MMNMKEFLFAAMIVGVYSADVFGGPEDEVSLTLKNESGQPIDVFLTGHRKNGNKKWTINLENNQDFTATEADINKNANPGDESRYPLDYSISFKVPGKKLSLEKKCDLGGEKLFHSQNYKYTATFTKKGCMMVQEKTAHDLAVEKHKQELQEKVRRGEDLGETDE